MFLLPRSAFAVRKTRHKGRGVVARADITPGAVIGDYLGTIRRPPRDDRATSHADQPYAMYRNERELIDPDPSSVGIHLINHGCEPNCGIALHRGHVLYVATRRVFAGEELVVSYWLPTPDRDEPWNRCACGAVHCRGVMDLPEVEYRATEAYWDRAAGVLMERRVVPSGASLPPLPRYPARVSDISAHALWGSATRAARRFDDRRLPRVRELRARMREAGRKLRFQRIGLLVEGLLVGGGVIGRRF